MKIEVFALCYNELRLMPFFIRHYLKFCDHITFIDNMSDDGSIEYVKSLKDPRLKIVQFETGKTLNDGIHANIKNNCWRESSCDYVIVVDFDEFLYHPDLKQFLSKTQSVIYKPFGYEMISDKFPENDVDLIEDVTEGVACSSYSKCCIFSPKIGDVNYDVGAHTCRPVTKRGIPILPYEDRDLKILHYKNLSYNYRIDRHRRFASRFSDFNKINRLGFHYEISECEQLKEYEHLWNQRIKVI